MLIFYDATGIINDAIVDAEAFTYRSAYQGVLSTLVLAEIENTKALCADLRTFIRKADDQGLKKYKVVAGVLKVALNWREAFPAELLAQGIQPPPYVAPVYDTNAIPAEVTPAFIDEQNKALANANVDGGVLPLDKVDRAIAAVLVDENNILRTWTRDLKTAVAAAATLAALKTGVAALSTLNDRTLAQARTAVKDKITSGAV
jgi:hypothetical protein